MKRLVVFLAALLIGITASVAERNNSSIAEPIPKPLKEVITKNLDYPKEAKANSIEGDVWMKICIGDDSKISIVELSATQPELGEYVKKELGNLMVNDLGCDSKHVYYLKVKFNMLDL